MALSLAGQKVAVVGLAKSGLAAIRLLLAQGAQVSALDARGEAALAEVAAQLKAEGVSLFLGAQPEASLLLTHGLVVVSPGVPLSLPVFQAVRDAGIPLWAEVELAYRFLQGRSLFGITGTNGKSTTTALTGVLFAQGQDADAAGVFVGGNLGRPFSEAAMPGSDFSTLVVELSSFQLEGIASLRPKGAALLNLQPDHLDRYPHAQAYAQAKARLFMNQGGGDFAVLNAEDPEVLLATTRLSVPSFAFALDPKALDSGRRWSGAAAAEGAGFWLEGAGNVHREHYRVDNRALRGSHNLQNAMAAALLGRLGGLSPDAVQEGLVRYPGLSHRLESARILDGVEWINDSKATNVDSVLRALAAFPQNVWLIAGGRGKGSSYAPLVEAARGQLKGLLTIGEDAKALAQAFEGQAPVHACETLGHAVSRARQLATSGDTVLLSPACASYDQFKNFEDRGETFKRLVEAL